MQLKFLTFIVTLFFGLCAAKADAIQKIEGSFKDTVVIGALDKVTARTSEITLKVGETVKIGTLIVRALRAWVSNPEEQPEAKVFFEITEQKERGPLENVFKGWMFASNPAVSALEHPVYDVWVIAVQGSESKGEASVSAPLLDAETSQRIDDLIDRLIPTDADDTSNAEHIDEIHEGHASFQSVAQ